MNRKSWKYLFLVALTLPTGSHAQSLKDLLNKENIEKVIPSLEALGFLDKDFIARLKAQLTEK